MEPAAIRIGSLSATSWRFFSATVAIAAGVAALATVSSSPWRLAIATDICAVLFGALLTTEHRGLRFLFGAAEAALAASSVPTVGVDAALGLAMVLAATQGLYHHAKAFGGAAGFVMAAAFAPDLAISAAARAEWALVYLAIACTSMVLQFQAQASMRNFRAFGHEFRTPLTNILQNAQMGMRSSPSAAQREYFDNIALAGRHMDMLLSNVLDFLRLMTGNYDTNASDANIVHLVDNVCRLVQPLRDQQQVALRTIAHGPLVRFRTNVEALRLCLLNLVSNAIKFTPHGQVAIVTRTFHDGRGYRLRVRVVDNGKGVPAHLRPRLFTEFTTGEPWNPVQRGSGLGLALVRELVQRQGGTAFYRPCEEGGSEFGFEFGVEPSDSTVDREAPANFLVVSHDEELCGRLAAKARQLERVPTHEALKAIIAARPRLGSVAVLDGRCLTTPIDVAARELDRIGKVPLFAVIEPAGELSAVELELALSGFKAVFDSRQDPDAIADSMARTWTSLIGDINAAELPTDLRAPFPGQVLVVEDDPMQLRYLTLTLSHSGVLAIGARSLAEARAALSSANDVRLAIVDYNLPDGDVVALIAEIRRAEKACGSFRLPIAVISAEERQVAMRELQGADYDWFQPKPITDPLRIVRMALKQLESQAAGHPMRDSESPPPNAAGLAAILQADFALAVSDSLASILSDAKESRWESAYRHAHKLKGLAALMDEQALVELCSRLTRQSPQPERSAEWLHALKKEAAAAIARASANDAQAAAG